MNFVDNIYAKDAANLEEKKEEKNKMLTKFVKIAKTKYLRSEFLTT